MGLTEKILVTALALQMFSSLPGFFLGIAELFVGACAFEEAKQTLSAFS